MPSPILLPVAPPLRIPRAWDALLAIESFEEAYPDGLSKPPAGRDEAAHVADPRPYRDDRREVSVSEGNLTATAILVSGDENYFVEWEVSRDGALVFESSASDGVDFNLGDRMELPVPRGPRLALRIERTDERTDEPTA